MVILSSETDNPVINCNLSELSYKLLDKTKQLNKFNLNFT